MTLEDLAKELPKLQELAKALWGDGELVSIVGTEIVEFSEDDDDWDEFNVEQTTPLFQYHLQQFVIADNPIEYLRRNIEGGDTSEAE